MDRLYFFMLKNLEKLLTQYRIHIKIWRENEKVYTKSNINDVWIFINPYFIL